MRRAHSGFREHCLGRDGLGRRAFLHDSLLCLGAALAPALIGACSEGGAARRSTGSGGSGGSGADAGSDAGVVLRSNFAAIGPLKDADENGLRVADGFTGRVVARTGQRPVATSEFLWHGAPDGGATYAAPDGGWIYVSNAETIGTAGASALRFDADARVIDAYRILSGTQLNCAGGLTPWGTWLSGEEHNSGRIHECDPFGKEAAVARPALGSFKHEAAAVDPVNHHVYLTEDQSDGRLYRYVPDALTPGGYADLTRGSLQVAVVDPEGGVTWKTVPDPAPGDSSTPTRLQVPDSTAFRGGEGMWYHAGAVYFTTKGDTRVWAYDVVTSKLRVLYAGSDSATSILKGVDNVCVSVAGDVLVAEDGDDMQIVLIAPDGSLKPIAQVTGHPTSEITGPALSPDGRRLYFSSQRADPAKGFESGVTFEITGPFLV